MIDLSSKKYLKKISFNDWFLDMVKVKGHVYDTVEIPRPSAPYITLEILSKDKNICKGSWNIFFKSFIEICWFYKVFMW